jgi:hypothetical protein
MYHTRLVPKQASAVTSDIFIFLVVPLPEYILLRSKPTGRVYYSLSDSLSALFPFKKIPEEIVPQNVVIVSKLNSTYLSRRLYVQHCLHRPIIQTIIINMQYKRLISYRERRGWVWKTCLARQSAASSFVLADQPQNCLNWPCLNYVSKFNKVNLCPNTSLKILYHFLCPRCSTASLLPTFFSLGFSPEGT